MHSGARLDQVAKNTWEMRPSGSAGHAQKLAPVLGSGQEGPPDHPGQWRKPWSLEQTPSLERGAVSHGGSKAPAASTRPFGFPGRSCPKEASPEGLRRSPAQVSVAPQSVAVPLLNNQTESQVDRRPFASSSASSPSCCGPPSIPFAPVPSKTQKNKSSCPLLPPLPPPAKKKKTYKCMRHIDCIKHDEFFRRELAGLPWLRLP